ncbi:hypothetical protein L6452_09247 [Arctium lappa]|uniref:Uncharacterized protein n=1 Tax=Arctium lappa TaxID=4217 RepID=A0ACB9DJY9_ARCLA|nr:hypothetical protein L6452_09247 [Arctium lappa]
MDADGNVPFFWGTDSGGHLVFSDDVETVKKGCGKSFTPFPKVWWVMILARGPKLIIPNFHVVPTFRLVRSLWKYSFSLTTTQRSREGGKGRYDAAKGGAEEFTPYTKVAAMEG